MWRALAGSWPPEGYHKGSWPLTQPLQAQSAEGLTSTVTGTPPPASGS